MSTELLATVAASIAACFSALTAWLSWSQQKQSAIDAIRPDLIMNGWTYINGNERGEIHIQFIQNVGAGPALHIRATLEVKGVHEPFAAYIICDPYPILPSGGKIVINSKGGFFWKHRPQESVPLIGLDLKLLYWDIRGNRYETNYYLVATSNKAPIGGTQELATGLYLCTRSTKRKSRHLMVLQSRMVGLRNRIKSLSGGIANKFKPKV